MLQVIQRRAESLPVGPILAEGFEFISPLLEQAMTYWQGIKGEAKFPLRADFEPEKIVTLWPYIVMVDVIDAGEDYFVRLFGQKLVDVYGEQTGRKMSESTVPELVWDRSKLLFDYCLAKAAPSYAYWPVTSPRKRALVDVEALCLPLSSDGTAPDKLISLNINSRRHS